ncbi:unnamed protein product [Echinostoma caproni]|uniref:G_PROTEIN_RECEP_F1_2 domain-containing protein n=1 Tax=Echinostoma caproni TaxID=27848 RepID=A0A183AAR8_9TREM|nr:unnamed protein product [Echinostoma caproni]
MMLPTVTFGVFADSLLTYLLTFRVRRPGHTHIHAAWISLFDVLFLIQCGHFHSLIAYGVPWWGMVIELPYTYNHLTCKIYNGFRGFILSGKNMLVFLMVAHILREGDRADMRATPPLVIHSQIIALLTVSIMISCFSGLVFGVHQQWGRFMCAPDPQYAKIVHQFYDEHMNLFVDGLYVHLCIFCLLWLVWRRKLTTEQILAYLHRIRSQRNPIGLAVCCVERRLLDWVRTYRVLLYQVSIFCLARTGRCLIRLADWTNFRILYDQAEDTPLAKATELSLTNGLLFIEIVLTSFPFVIWYVHVPQIQVHCKCMWMSFTCRWTVKQRQHYLKQFDPATYLEEALGILRNRQILEQHCKSVLSYLRNMDRQLRVKYDTLSSMTRDSRPTSVMDTSTTWSFSSIAVQHTKSKHHFGLSQNPQLGILTQCFHAFIRGHLLYGPDYHPSLNGLQVEGFVPTVINRDGTS